MFEEELPDLVLRLEKNTICYFNCPKSSTCLGKKEKRNFPLVCDIKELKEKLRERNEFDSI